MSSRAKIQGSKTREVAFMGTPGHYSRDVVVRCQHLIEECLPLVQASRNRKFGGPLSTTFLLAMATPMIILPIERIIQPGQRTSRRAGKRVADERIRDKKLSERMDEFCKKPFGATEFGRRSHWSRVSGFQYFNTAGWWPDELLGMLGGAKAIEDCNSVSALDVLKDLRNALAHGAIAYLNAAGNHVEGDEAAMLAFGAFNGGDQSSLNVLRISEAHFRSFLAAWSDWLSSTAIPDVLNEAGVAAA